MRTPRWQLKIQARRTITASRRTYGVMVGTLLALMLATMLLQGMFGGMGVLMRLDMRAFPMENGAWIIDAQVMGQLLAMSGLEGLSHTGGLLMSMQMEAAETVMVLLVPWSQIPSFAWMQVVVLIALAPFRMGALEQMAHARKGGEEQPRAMFRWYARPDLLIRALAVELALGLWQWFCRLLSMAPGLACLLIGSRREGDPLLLGLSSLLTAAGPLAAFWLYCLLLPARHVMALEPQLGPVQAIRKGARLLRGRRKRLFFFRLSFLGWNLVSALLYDLPSAYVFAYEETATLGLLEEESRLAELERSGDGMNVM